MRLSVTHKSVLPSESDKTLISLSQNSMSSLALGSWILYYLLTFGCLHEHAPWLIGVTCDRKPNASLWSRAGRASRDSLQKLFFMLFPVKLWRWKEKCSQTRNKALEITEHLQRGRHISQKIYIDVVEKGNP